MPVVVESRVTRIFGGPLKSEKKNLLTVAADNKKKEDFSGLNGVLQRGGGGKLQSEAFEFSSFILVSYSACPLTMRRDLRLRHLQNNHRCH